MKTKVFVKCICLVLILILFGSSNYAMMSFSEGTEVEDSARKNVSLKEKEKEIEIANNKRRDRIKKITDYVESCNKLPDEEKIAQKIISNVFDLGYLKAENDEKIHIAKQSYELVSYINSRKGRKLEIGASCGPIIQDLEAVFIDSNSNSLDETKNVVKFRLSQYGNLPKEIDENFKNVAIENFESSTKFSTIVAKCFPWLIYKSNKETDKVIHSIYDALEPDGEAFIFFNDFEPDLVQKAKDYTSEVILEAQKLGMKVEYITTDSWSGVILKKS